eukprot:TRINITY_DN3623_c0_g1_i1.p1 TRINITY_DN3623_c0_g1~~TRINITY_DN3623_c0_g1_i1.p1  ORF type:complete len:251 (-),score=64.08 TRINITY_DN3623_c0_g1_i1:9-761(-)
MERDEEGNENTRYGIQQEEIIRRKYEEKTGNKVEEIGLTWHWDESKNYLGATPDGFIEKDILSQQRILLEIKCPVYGQWNEVPVEYMPQIQMQMEIFDCSFCDFACYFKQTKKIVVWRVERSKAYWVWMENRLRYFWICVQLNQEPSSDLIPYVHHETVTLVKTNYHLEGPVHHRERIMRDRLKFPPQTKQHIYINEDYHGEDVMTPHSNSRKQPLQNCRIHWTVVFFSLLFLGCISCWAQFPLNSNNIP